MEEEPRRRIGAEAEVERVPERQLTGEPHHHVPRLTDVSEVEDQRGHRQDVAARHQGKAEQNDARQAGRQEGKDRSTRETQVRALPSSPWGRASSTTMS